MLIERSGLNNHTLDKKVILVTGGGGGIGLECVRALLWLGATVIVAEKNPRSKTVINELKLQYKERLCFRLCDISKKTAIKRLVKMIRSKYRCIDGVINNATIVPLGALDEVNSKKFEHSYHVNLRAPFLLYRSVIPIMKKQKFGTFILVSSSGAASYLGAYEVFKTAQVEFANNASMELEGTGISVFTIAPGFIKTDTAVHSIEVIADKYGKSASELFDILGEHTLSVEAAGVGFALAFINPEKYHGTEISGTHLLSEFKLSGSPEKQEGLTLTDEQKRVISEQANKVSEIYSQQYNGWFDRNVFERQWVLRNFKKQCGINADEMLVNIQSFLNDLNQDKLTKESFEHYGLDKLAHYFLNQIKLMEGYVKDPVKKEEYRQALTVIHDEIVKIDELIKKT